jgi:hypothetical protein
MLTTSLLAVSEVDLRDLLLVGASAASSVERDRVEGMSIARYVEWELTNEDG